jgi:SAM-dependent methyltransferase
VTDSETRSAGSAYALSFGLQAERYDKYRPSYPTGAIDFALPPGDTGCVIDLGAGTGKLTAGLLGRAAKVIAVEPDDRMRAVLRTRFASADGTVEVRAGTAEATGLDDGVADAVVAGQAFHWFARPQADFEIARILRPRGVCSLIWNLPDAEVQWVRDLYSAIGDDNPPWSRSHSELDRSLFEQVETSNISWHHVLDGPEALLNLVHTWSFVLTKPAGQQAEIDAAVRSLIKRTSELRGSQIQMPMHTTVTRQLLT